MEPFFSGLFFAREKFQDGILLHLKNFKAGFFGVEKIFARNFSREKFLSAKIFEDKKYFL
jgi:hypothetical protein